MKSPVCLHSWEHSTVPSKKERKLRLIILQLRRLQRPSRLTWFVLLVSLQRSRFSDANARNSPQTLKRKKERKKVHKVFDCSSSTKKKTWTFSRSSSSSRDLSASPVSIRPISYTPALIKKRHWKICDDGRVEERLYVGESKPQ